jgi:hypothetical protein
VHEDGEGSHFALLITAAAAVKLQQETCHKIKVQSINLSGQDEKVQDDRQSPHFALLITAAATAIKLLYEACQQDAKYKRAG